ncbi:MAG TPA: O-antigen ligase family protein [Patescibacteria group bacterium]|jgi:O-antigen ligase
MISAIGAEQTLTVAGPIAWVAVMALLLGAFLFTRRHPGGGLGLVVAALPLYQVRGSLGLPTTLLELLLGAVLLGILSRWPAYKPRWSPYDPWLALWAGGSLVAALLAPDPQQGLGLWRAFFLEPVLFFVVARTVFTKESARPIAYGAAAAVGITALWTAALALGGTALSYDGRLTGPFQSANFLAHLGVPLGLLLIGWPQRLPAYVRYVPALLALGLLAGSQSRGGVLAFAIGAATLVALRSGAVWLKRGAVVALALGLVATAGLTLVERSDQYSTRSVLWKTALEVVGERPLLGAGPEHFQDEVRRRMGGDEELRQFVIPRAPDAHNVFLVTWTEWGLLALLGLLGLLGTAARLLYRRRDAWVPPAAAMTAAIVTHGLVDTPILKNDLALVFMVVLLLTVLPQAAKRRAA